MYRVKFQSRYFACYATTSQPRFTSVEQIAKTYSNKAYGMKQAKKIADRLGAAVMLVSVDSVNTQIVRPC